MKDEYKVNKKLVCLYKRILALGMAELIITLIITIIIVFLGINIVPMWVVRIYGIGMGVIVLGGILALITHWEEVIDWLKSELSCK